MNWKIFLAAFINGLFILFPANILGCAGYDEDPYDYFTSFFSHSQVKNPGSKMFFYTGLAQFYSDEEDQNKISIHDRIVNEWTGYAKGNAKKEDVRRLVYDYSEAELRQLTQRLQTSIGIADANTMVNYLFSTRDKDALEYLLIARQTESLSEFFEWQAAPKKDSNLLNTLRQSLIAHITSSRNQFICQRLALQLCKISFYSGQHEDVISYYNRYFNLSPVSSVQQLALSYKAGSEYRLKKYKVAAYSFSKLFASNYLNRKDIYLGFLWSTNWASEELEDEFAQICQNKNDEIIMRTLFAMYGSEYRLNSIINLYDLDRHNPMLPLLVSREVHKLEEKYFSPRLEKMGGKSYYYSWRSDERDMSEDRGQLELTKKYILKIAADKVADPAFYLGAAAHLSFISGKFEEAKTLIKKASLNNPSLETRDQLHMIRLLIVANETKKIDREVEKRLLPSLTWLKNKADKDSEYANFYRNLFSQVMAGRYTSQKDKPRVALSLGVGDKYNEYSGYGTEYLQNEMDTHEILALYRIFTSKNPSAFEKFMIKNSSIGLRDIVDVMGTSYMRSHNFPKAIEWLKKSRGSDTLSFYKWDGESGYSDPFFDYVNDSERYNRKARKPWTKLSLATEMVKLENKLALEKNSERKARLYFQLATAYYNMSYYGNSYDALVYYRPTNDWNGGEYKAGWEREYFSVHKSKSYYQKAYMLTKNKEFRAACYFLFIKCDQRQVITGPYTWGPTGDSTWLQFKYNRYFPRFISEFGNTRYYNYVFDRCSYLRDFVDKY